MIQIEGISHYFGINDPRATTTKALSDVSLTIADQRIVSLLGPSGCGKTTLLRIISGLVDPTEGTVVIDGTVVSGPARDRTVVFQDFNLLPWRTVLRNVEFALEALGVGRTERRGRASDALASVGLSDFESYYPHQLSGGMRQRVGIARALCTNPRYVLMDEPFGALDPQTRELMQIDLEQIWERDRKTIIFVTHSIEEAIFLSDQIVVMSARPGRVLEVIDVNLGRPRWQNDEAIKSSSEFVALRQSIWHELRLQQQPVI